MTPECMDTYSSADTKHAHKGGYTRARTHAHALTAAGHTTTRCRHVCAHQPHRVVARVSRRSDGLWGCPPPALHLQPRSEHLRQPLGLWTEPFCSEAPRATARVWYARPVCPQGQASKCSLCSLARREPCLAPAACPRGSRKASVCSADPAGLWESLWVFSQSPGPRFSMNNSCCAFTS